MLIKTLLAVLKKQQTQVPIDIENFSIKQVGSKFYVYAHWKNTGKAIKIGTYKSYECAKQAIDNILDLKIKDYGT